MNPVSVSERSIPPGGHPDTIHTLVVGADAAYHDRARAVLGELGSVAFALQAPADAAVVSSLVHDEQAAVVVLDATGCETEVQAVIAALAAEAPRLGVVVVCEHLTGGERDLPALPKWGWTRDLRVAVLNARHDGSPFVPRATLAAAATRRELRAGARVRAGRR